VIGSKHSGEGGHIGPKVVARTIGHVGMGASSSGT